MNERKIEIEGQGEYANTWGLRWMERGIERERERQRTSTIENKATHIEYICLYAHTHSISILLYYFIYKIEKKNKKNYRNIFKQYMYIVCIYIYIMLKNKSEAAASVHQW